MYEPRPPSKPVAALLSCHVVRTLKFRCYVFIHSLLKWDIKAICGRLARPGNILCLMKRCCGVHRHRDLKLTDHSLTSKNNKPALSQDPHCQDSQQMRSICGRWFSVQVPAWMPQWRTLFLFLFLSLSTSGKCNQVNVLCAWPKSRKT